MWIASSPEMAWKTVSEFRELVMLSPGSISRPRRARSSHLNCRSSLTFPGRERIARRGRSPRNLSRNIVAAPGRQREEFGHREAAHRDQDRPGRVNRRPMTGHSARPSQCCPSTTQTLDEVQEPASAGRMAVRRGGGSARALSRPLGSERKRPAETNPLPIRYRAVYASQAVREGGLNRDPPPHAAVTRCATADAAPTRTSASRMRCSHVFRSHRAIRTPQPDRAAATAPAPPRTQAQARTRGRDARAASRAGLAATITACRGEPRHAAGSRA